MIYENSVILFFVILVTFHMMCNTQHLKTSATVLLIVQLELLICHIIPNGNVMYEHL